jgi:hypothetical protein
MNLIRGFSEFRKLVNQSGIPYKYERVRPKNWCVYYCVYTLPEHIDKLREYVDAYNQSKSNRSYINLHAYSLEEFNAIRTKEV